MKLKNHTHSPASVDSRTSTRRVPYAGNQHQRLAANFGKYATLAACCCLLCLPSTRAAAQTAPPPQSVAAEQSNDGYGPNYNGQDFTRPQNSFATRVEYRESSNTTSATDRERLMLQLSSKIDLGEGWKIGLLEQVPFVVKTTTTFETANSSTTAGGGGSVFQPSLIRSIDKYWAFGFGARLEAPSVPSSVGSGNWQIMPGVGVRYSFLDIGPDTYFVPVVRYAMSFAGDPTRRTIREPQIAPTLNIGLPDHWFVT